ncbi:MAG: nucleoside deaminase [Alphaproteobacteria bacterium]|nr:nucleoside deaminase [Alphaproteobacteria bacterium]
MPRKLLLTCSRRTWLFRTTALGVLLGSAGRPISADAATKPIAQPPARTGESFIRRAFAMRDRATTAGDQPYGAIVVKDGHIVGEAPSRVISAGDPTAHAETEAIRDAARRLGTRDLGGCVLYSSSRPCPMCEAAAYWANVEKMVHGAAATDAGPPSLNRC